MNVLITDMLSLAKLEEGKVTITKQPFDLSEVIMECTLPFEAMVFENKKNIEYMVAPNVKANTDKNSVKMLINILLDNAVKYASENGKIIVYLNRVKNKTIFSIYNTGSNVPNKDSARIFERFYRADSSRSRDSGGSGLGLAIAKNLANRNKWKIYADSKQGESMTITVLF
jgi:signal transduction histidine kinase